MLIRLIIAIFVLLLTGCSEKAVMKGDIRLHDLSGIVEDEGYLITFATGRQTKMQASSGERQYQG
jgi:hypothetical protein